MASGSLNKISRPEQEPEIVYESAGFVVVNKPAGLQVHAARIAGSAADPIRRPAAGRTGAMRTLADWLVARYPEMRSVGDDPEFRPGIVHRLDKETSGILVAARTQAAFRYLKSLFEKREVRKTYLAVVRGVPKERRGVIDAPIGIRNGSLKRSVRSLKMAKEAVTEYRVLRTFAMPPSSPSAQPDAYSLLEVVPKTGRTHQIRVHLASIGHPVAGDRLYGPRAEASAKTAKAKAQPEGAFPRRLMLHALSLEFTAPDGERVKCETEPPEEFRDVIHK